MKKQNQIGKNSKAATPIPQPKPTAERRVRVRLRVSKAFKQAIDKAAKKLGITRSRFCEVAIQSAVDSGALK